MLFVPFRKEYWFCNGTGRSIGRRDDTTGLDAARCRIGNRRRQTISFLVLLYFIEGGVAYSWSPRPLRLAMFIARVDGDVNSSSHQQIAYSYTKTTYRNDESDHIDCTAR